MTLDKVKKGQRIKIKAIPNNVIRAQAIRFGIHEGANAVCEAVIPAGPVVLSKNRQEIAIGRSLAKEIDIEVVQ